MAADSSITSAVPPEPPRATPAPAPVKKAVLSPERFLARLVRLDRVLLVLVVVLAFLTASFVATNSDILQHLAVGRLVAQGNYHFGVDPFTFTTEGVYWANHSWLFGLIAYGIYSISTIGGTLLVVLKALCCVLLAVVMVRSSWRPGERWWLPATLTGVAVLAISPRLLLQPTFVSFLFLGLTVWFLIRPAPQKAWAWRPAERKKKGRAPGKSIPLKAYWPLPVLCLAWVNLDQWFFLGPLTVGLYLLGVALQEQLHPLPRDADDPAEEPRTLGLVLLGCVAACFISPHHVHVFVLPPQLGFGPAAQAVADEPMFRNMFLSPLSMDSNSRLSYFNERTGLSVAGMAYFPLLLLGLLSFILTAGTMRLWRAAVWLFFAGLSLYHARAIPFFAVVAAPITTLNFLDFACRRYGADYFRSDGARSWAVSGRILTLFLTLLLLVASVPGWTQAVSHAERRVGWGVAVDPSLEKAALQIAAWRKEGKLPANLRWFNTTPDVVNYFAWYCPGEKGFFDQRLTPFDKVAEDFVKARKAFLPPETPAQVRTDPQPLADVIEKYQINLVACYRVDQWWPQIAEYFLASSGQWPRVYGQGGAALFWRKTPGKEREEAAILALTVDDAHAAFGPDDKPAPPQRPAREPRTPEMYEELWTAPPPHFNFEADDAQLNFRIFNAESPRWRQAILARFEPCFATAVLGLTVPGSPQLFEAAMLGQMFLPTAKEFDRATGLQKAGFNLRRNYVFNPGLHDSGPPASLYLALRAARRALVKDPDDASIYLLLARIYQSLQTRTREGGFSPNELMDFRRDQILVALQQAVRLNPNLDEAHLMLAEEYSRLGYVDLYAKHMREYLRCVQESPGALARKKGDDTAKAIQNLEETVQKLEAEVKRRQDQFVVTHAKKSPVEKAAIALQTNQEGVNGLAETALEVLRSVDFKELGKTDLAASRAAAMMQIDVLFLMGQLSEIRDALKEEGAAIFLGINPVYRLPSADWYKLRLAAATGDYAVADEILEKVREQIAGSLDRQVFAERLRDMLLRTAPLATGMAGPLPAMFELFEFFDRLQRGASSLDYQRDLFNGLYEAYRLFPNQGLWFLAFRDAAREMLAPMVREAEVCVLRGWLALEAGDNKVAAEQLRAALTKRWPPRHVLPAFLMLGATSPVEVLSSLYGGAATSTLAYFEFSSYRLAVMGLEWLEAQEK